MKPYSHKQIRRRIKTVEQNLDANKEELCLEDLAKTYKRLYNLHALTGNTAKEVSYLSEQMDVQDQIQINNYDKILALQKEQIENNKQIITNNHAMNGQMTYLAASKLPSEKVVKLVGDYVKK